MPSIANKSNGLIWIIVDNKDAFTGRNQNMDKGSKVRVMVAFHLATSAIMFLGFGLGLFGQATETIPGTIRVKEKGLHARGIYVSDGEALFSKPIFQYGQQAFFIFKDLEGLTQVDGKYYPNFDVALVSKQGDTIFSQQGLLGPDDRVAAISEPTFNILSEFSDGMVSNEAYRVLGTVRDTKSKNRLLMEMDFSLVPNPLIEVTKNGLDYTEVYLFSEDRQAIITDNTVSIGETVSLVFKNLEGFAIGDDGVLLELDYTVMDSLGNLVIDNTGFFVQTGETDGIQKGKVDMTFELIDDKAYDLKASLVLKAKVLDKNSDVKIEVVTRLFTE